MSGWHSLRRKWLLSNFRAPHTKLCLGLHGRYAAALYRGLLASGVLAGGCLLMCQHDCMGIYRTCARSESSTASFVSRATDMQQGSRPSRIQCCVVMDAIARAPIAGRRCTSQSHVQTRRRVRATTKRPTAFPIIARTSAWSRAFTLISPKASSYLTCHTDLVLHSPKSRSSTKCSAPPKDPAMKHEYEAGGVSNRSSEIEPE